MSSQNLVQKSNVLSFGRVFNSAEIAEAFVKAYPGLVTKSFEDGDWILTLRGKKFAIAEGKLLPLNELKNQNAYDPFVFYSYERGPLTFKKLAPSEVERLKSTLMARENRPVHRSTSFYDTLWQIDSVTAAKKVTKAAKFLGFSVLANSFVADKLKAIEAEVREVQKVDAEVRAFVGSLDNIDGYNFRNILKSTSRSNHSYGTAFDLIPKSYKKQIYYWQLLQNDGLAWWDTPIEKRMKVPQALIEIFEKYGFVWGGKWLFFDAVHFEYRPEILILNGML